MNTGEAIVKINEVLNNKGVVTLITTSNVFEIDDNIDFMGYYKKILLWDVDNEDDVTKIVSSDIVKIF